jgi:hypothetical protein
MADNVRNVIYRLRLRPSRRYEFVNAAILTPTGYDAAEGSRLMISIGRIAMTEACRQLRRGHVVPELATPVPLGRRQAGRLDRTPA